MTFAIGGAAMAQACPRSLTIWLTDLTTSATTTANSMPPATGPGRAATLSGEELERVA
jgi:hypothetical protein